MLNERDIALIAPYVEGEERVVNLEVKDRGRKGREILLEYESGKKFAGNLNESPFVMRELKGLSSIASYFARGKYGSNSWRGNCSGLLIKDLLAHYQPEVFGDLAVGSGTSIEVARDLGYTESNSVFSDLNPAFGGIDISGPDLDFPLMDFIFFHPPYYVFPGSNMPVYSGKAQGGMWGDEIIPTDGSRISDQHEFKRWFDVCNANLYRLLRKGGRLAILMGDSRFRGEYFSMFKHMDVFGQLEQVIIKEQHNCFSDMTKYSGKFIPLAHEYLVVIRKASPYIIPITHTKFLQADIRTSKKSTWASVIAMFLEGHNGEMEQDDLVEKLKQHPKAANNNHVAAKVRQEIHLHPRMFSRRGSKVCLATPC